MNKSVFGTSTSKSKNLFINDAQVSLCPDVDIDFYKAVLELLDNNLQKTYTIDVLKSDIYKGFFNATQIASFNQNIVFAIDLAIYIRKYPNDESFDVEKLSAIRSEFNLD